MTPMDKTRKMCPNGHLMDPEWDLCPYCPSDRAADPSLARTVKMEERLKEPAPSPAREPRRTEILTAAGDRAAAGWLVGAAGAERSAMHRVDPTRTTLGAGAACDVVLDAAHVSDLHASLRFRDGAFHVTDLDSTNGTFVNGERVQQRRLEDGDRLAFGASEWIFKCVVFEEA